ncbi:MAG: hypothetical protein UT43_C0017G0001 [Parcubacteria group bacterium GW2011_GWC1_39_29]|nr:MAG: hypothetical protein UT43_C0017G0001 [Parcubacteria group bacterium GW2011_GWC1_39_29]
MNNFGKFITPEEAQKLGDKRSLEEFKNALKNNDICEVCNSFPIWKYGYGNDTGLCFTCTTGETDASNDQELSGVI